MAATWIDRAPSPAPLAPPPHLPQGIGYRFKVALLGRALTRDAVPHQRLSKRLALGVLASDCISSSAYGTEEMLIVLLPVFGIAGLAILLPLTAVILVVLTVVTLSYRDVVTVYTRTGGSYVVARENFGPVVAQVAAVALMLDYIVTVAIQSAAGTAALTSGIPATAPWSLEITVAWVLVMFYGNLRGIREAGRMFALPTYLFAGSMAVVLVTGVVREVIGDLPKYPLGGPGAVPIGSGQSVLTWFGLFILLRAFANGGSSLTGLEAISNGVSVFHRPAGLNARRTLVAMSLILGTLVAGVSWLAHQTHAQPYQAGTPTVISQVAAAVFGSSSVGHALFLVVQLATLMILWTGANTPFSGFPFLASFVAEDQFLPRQLTRRGHRLAYSNGIIVLTLASLALLLGTGAHVDKLVAFYAIGVFTGFTFAGFGMARYFSRHRRGPWRMKVGVNLTSGAVSLVVVLVFAVVKFTEGAWLVVLIFPLAVAVLVRLNRQYRREAATLAVASTSPRWATISRHEVLVLADSVDLATIAAVRYAHSLHPASLRAVHLVVDDAHAEELRTAWCAQASLRDIPLDLIDCPDRRLVHGVAELATRRVGDPGIELTLLLPRRSYGPVFGRLLHDGTADQIARAISRLPRVVATIVPFDVAGLIARREEAEEAQRHNGAAVAPPGARVPVQATVSASVAPAIETPTPNGTRRSLSPDATEPATPPETAPTPISGLQWRHRASVEGRVRTVRVAAMSGAPCLEVELWDDTAGVTLVFYGRRGIPGITPGAALAVEGMVGERHGRAAMANPRYRLLGTAAG
jgi:amino acid transporter